MSKFGFTLFLNHVSEITEDAANALYEAGCDDASPASCDGSVWITFHREAKSLHDAIRSSVREVQQAGFQVGRLEIAGEALDGLLVTSA